GERVGPVGVGTGLVADETGIGAVLAYDRDLGLLGKSLLEPVGEPIGIGVAHYHDRGVGLRLLLRRRRRMRIVGRGLTLVAWIRREPTPERVAIEGLLLLALRTITPVPELGLRRQQPDKADARPRRSHKSPGHDGGAHDPSADRQIHNTPPLPPLREGRQARRSILLENVNLKIPPGNPPGGRLRPL